MQGSGSVTVENLMVSRKYFHVQHLVSRLKADFARRIRSLALTPRRVRFPAEWFPGAPKVRAIEIIQNLEPERNLCGRSVAIDYSGNLDVCDCHSHACFGNAMKLPAWASIVADSGSRIGI